MGGQRCDADEYGDPSRDAKRPRVETCAKASAGNVATYRTKHEITVMVSYGT